MRGRKERNIIGKESRLETLLPLSTYDETSTKRF
jgi:hypothetical protein